MHLWLGGGGADIINIGLTEYRAEVHGLIFLMNPPFHAVKPERSGAGGGCLERWKQVGAVFKKPQSCCPVQQCVQEVWGDDP